MLQNTPYFARHFLCSFLWQAEIIYSMNGILNACQWRTQEFCSGGGGSVQQIQLRSEDRENGDLGAVAP